jgi:hypothetical protein
MRLRELLMLLPKLLMMLRPLAQLRQVLELLQA